MSTGRDKQVSSDPHNPMPEPGEAETAPGVLDQGAAPGFAHSAEEQPASGGAPLPPESAAAEAGTRAISAPGPEAAMADGSAPPAAPEEGGTQPEVSPAEAPPQAACAPEKPVEASAAGSAEPTTAQPVPGTEAPASAPPRPKSDRMDWYILKVQSNREESIREGLRRRIAIAGYEHYFGDIIIPMEKVTEVKGGKKRTYKRKLYPGYLMVQMEINEDTWFLVRETPGIGDFAGAGGHPTPMNPREVQAILAKQEEKPDQQEKVKINFRIGDRVKIREGTFESFEGEVSNIDETNGRVTVLINIFGRSTPVDIEYWQIEAV